MADPSLVLLIVIGATTADRPRGSVVSGAVAEGLGTDAHVLVEERVVAPTDLEAAATSNRLGSHAVAEIQWSDATHSRARLHVYLASDQAWYDRDVAFEPVDSTDDRERAVGLLVGAMVRAKRSEEGAAPAGVAPLPLAPAAPAPSPPAEAPPKTEPDRAPALAPAAETRFGADLGAVATAGIGGQASAVGPSIRGRIAFTEALSIHAGVAVGFASVDDASATMTTTRIAGGGRWRFVALGRDRDVGFDLGLEAIVVHHALHRVGSDASRDRWLSGGHLDVGVVFRVTRAFEPFATAGVDGVLGATPITVGGERVAQLPLFRAIVEAGARIHF